MNFKTRLLCMSVALAITIGIGSKPVARTAASIAPDVKRGLPDKLGQAKLIESYGKLPLSFEANHGQTDQRVKFLSRGRGYTLFLTSDETVLSFRGSQAHPKEETVVAQCSPSGAGPLPGLSSVQAAGCNSVLQQLPNTQGRYPHPMSESQNRTATSLRMTLVGANPHAKTSGIDEQPGKANYFIGNDPAKWRTNVATYAKVRYREVYPGVDLVYYGNQGQLESDFVLSAGANPNRIAVNFQGADKLEVDGRGDLLLHIADSSVVLRKPFMYQEVDGVRREIAGGYLIEEGQKVGFRVADYDRSKPLVIDPVLSYSTYLGGSGNDWGYGIAVDSSGNAYVTGYTNSINFPGTSTSTLQPTNGGFVDAFVTKIADLPLTTVPDVVGLTQAAATTAIINAHLVLGTVGNQASNTVAAGLVISESPTAGTQVNSGTAVNLVVSTGPPNVSVPNVVGLTQAAATTAITTAGLVLGTVTNQSSNTVAAGRVISESPVAGTPVNQGSAVNLVVSTGVPPTVLSFNVLFGSQSYNVSTSARHRLPWQITGIRVVFSKSIATGGAASLGGVTVTGFTGLGTNTLTWLIAPVPQGNLAPVLSGSGPTALLDAAGNSLAGGAGFTQALKILWGDFNDDGVVSAADLVGVNNATIAPYNVFADMNGDGVVTIADVQIVRTRVGTSLP
jgi:Beta-propeller repeat/PASTA domain/Dockerin type I domain